VSHASDLHDIWAICLAMDSTLTFLLMLLDLFDCLLFFYTKLSNIVALYPHEKLNLLLVMFVVGSLFIFGCWSLMVFASIPVLYSNFDISVTNTV
jgi:hypothetical protein